VQKLLPSDIDKECVVLCEAMNKLSGIRTSESCCGHYKTPFHIWFNADSLEVLPPLLYWFDGCHCGYYGWSIRVRTDCGMCPAFFYVEGPIGTQAYMEAEEIARLITDYVDKGQDPDSIWEEEGDECVGL